MSNQLEDLTRDRELRTALVADALDGLGLGGRCFGHDIRALSGSGVLVGRAVTAVAIDLADRAATTADDPYGGLKETLQGLGPRDILVLATKRSDHYAAWGELVSMAASAQGALGFVSDGLVRDLDQVRRLGFPVFARGTSPTDIAGRAILSAVGAPVVIDAVSVATGDLVVADADGVVIVPEAAVADVLTGAGVRAAAERMFHEALAGGASIWDAFDQTGVM